MKIDLNVSFLPCLFYLINSILCDDFKCPERGKVGELKVPNALSLIDKQTGYHASVEVINPTRKNLIHDYYDWKNKVGWIDLEATIQDKMNRRYYYHSTEEKIAVRENKCTRLDLTQNEKIESIKDWFEPTDIVANSEMFKDFIHLGPTGLMIYANSISDKASFIGSELIEGRTVNHWFYCTKPDGPYIDFYFDVKTSLPYRFSLYYPKWIETQEVISINETRTVKKQVDSESKYVYNFYMFKPLVISSDDPIPYPLGYGCARKGTFSFTPLPDFSQVNKFTLDMEAIITYFKEKDPIKTTARVMKRGNVISYEIEDRTGSIRLIDMPIPLGRFTVNEKTGKCKLLPAHMYYYYYHTIVPQWPLFGAFNLLNYLVMKPTENVPTFIGEIPLGPFRVEEYKAPNFFANQITAFVDYYYTKNGSDSVPSKVIFTKDPTMQFYNYLGAPNRVEVTIINYEKDNIDYEDRFDVSGCYEEPGNFTWFQLLFSNPWTSNFDMQEIKESTEEYLTSFIPITRIGAIHTQEVDSNIYVTVKLHDRVRFIEAYNSNPEYKISDPTNIVKRSKVEDCEQLCSATEKCNHFSFCSNSDCLIYQSTYQASTEFEFDDGCTSYELSPVESAVEPLVLINENYLSTMSHVLQQIRNKVSSGEFRLPIGLSAEDLFVVNGPEEIGDISQQLYKQGSTPLRGEDFPIIKTDRHFNEAQLKTEKGTLQDCFMACVNDDDCNSLSYCIDQNKECILSGETWLSSNETLEDKISHADGCNIYQKSFINLFQEKDEKSLVVDAVSTISDVSIGDCAKTCAQSKSFNCESFDYCENNNRNESVCFLHVNHIENDKAHQIDIINTNWKFAEAGCRHYSKKSELDYEHKVGFALKDNMKESIVGTFDHLSLEHCASKCNSDADCFTFEFCQLIDLNENDEASVSLTSCSLTNLKPSNVNQLGLFEASKRNNKICSIYINHKKITGKSKTDPQPSESPKRSNNFNLTIGLSTMIFILAFTGGFIAFKFAYRQGIIS